MTTNFCFNNSTLWTPKTDANTVTSPNTQWAAADTELVRLALLDIKTAVGTLFINVKAAYGAVGNGLVDDTAAIQAAITENPGRTIYFPRGRYLISSTLFITSTCTHLLGDFFQRSTNPVSGVIVNGGTELYYTGTGPVIQIGTDNGLGDWAFADLTHGYDGPQDHSIENLWIRHVAPDTPLNSVGTVDPHFKTGAYGIWDWRGGGIILRNVGIEAFESNYVGIQSDINFFFNVSSFYSKYGCYFGPRSDQNRIYGMYSFFCDRCITIDRAGQTEIYGGVYAFCGTATSSHIEIRRGSHGALIHGAWFENSGVGFQGNMQSFVSAGEVSGYGAGGSISSPGGTPTTTPVAGVSLRNPHCYNLPAGAAHTNYLASVGFCNQFVLEQPTEYILSGLSSFNCLVAIQAGFAPTATDTQIAIYDAPETLLRTQCFQNLGAGAVTAYIRNFRSHDSVILGLDTTASHTIRGAITHAAPAGVNAFTTTNANVGQTAAPANWRLVSSGSYDTTAGALFPVGVLIQHTATRNAGANSLGSTALSVDCTGGQSNQAVITARGDNRFNQTSGIFEIAQSLYLSKRVAPTTLTTDQTDWNFTGLSDATIIFVTSTVNVLINSMVIDANSANGRDVIFYNNNALGGATQTLVHEAGTGTAARKFQGKSYANTVVNPGNGFRLRYDSTISRIIVL